MAATHDGEANIAYSMPNLTTARTITGKTTAGTNRVGIVVAGYNGPQLTATWNGVSMSRIVEDVNTDSGLSIYAVLFAIANPPTGASDIVITGNGVDNFKGAAIVSSFQDADQSAGAAAFSATASATGLATDQSVTITGGSGEIIIDCAAVIHILDTDMTKGAAQTLIGRNWDGTDGEAAGSSYKAGSGSSTAMTWDSTGQDHWTQVAASLKAASSGPGAGADSATIGYTESSSNLIRVSIVEETA